MKNKKTDKMTMNNRKKLILSLLFAGIFGIQSNSWTMDDILIKKTIIDNTNKYTISKQEGSPPYKLEINKIKKKDKEEKKSSKSTFETVEATIKTLFVLSLFACAASLAYTTANIETFIQAIMDL